MKAQNWRKLPERRQKLNGLWQIHKTEEGRPHEGHPTCAVRADEIHQNRKPQAEKPGKFRRIAGTKPTFGVEVAR